MRLRAVSLLRLTGLTLSLSLGCNSDGVDAPPGSNGTFSSTTGGVSAGAPTTGNPAGTSGGWNGETSATGAVQPITGDTPFDGGGASGTSGGGQTQLPTTGPSVTTGGLAEGGPMSPDASLAGDAQATGGDADATAGEAGTDGGTLDGGGAGPVPPRPSVGCGKANPELGTSRSPLNAGKPYYVKLPTNYDPNTPYRVLFVFNPTGNPITWAENSAGYERLPTKDSAIRVYPHENPRDLGRSPGGWSGDDVASFGPLYEAIVSNFCVDEERVFATGESSGGDFASVLGCEYGDKLRGVGPCATKPVGGYPLNPSQRNCKGDVTAIVIHGKADSVVGPENGPATRDFYTAVNECSGVSEPVPGYTDSLSNCVMFTGCKQGYPVYWCQHQDPEYGGTSHGWPKFAAKMTWEVFEAY